MNTNYYRAKAAVICFCLFLTATCLTAQNTGYYKYIINHDLSFNTDVLLIDNQYYVLSNGDRDAWYFYEFPYAFHPTTTITVFDESFNKIKQVQLLDNKSFEGTKFFYKDNHFYVFGYKYNPSAKRNKICIAKFDKDFNLVAPLSLHNWDDNFHYFWRDIIETKKNEFMGLIYKGVAYGEKFEGLVHISNEGDFLQESLTSFIKTGSIVETDSHYLVTFAEEIHGNILKFYKDSLEKQEVWYIGQDTLGGVPDGNALMIDNQFIYTAFYEEFNAECNNDNHNQCKNSIVFLDENMNLKNRLIVGKDCEFNTGGWIHYINPDSIYTVHRSRNNFKRDSTTYDFFSITNFSKDGKLNFTFNLDIKDSLPARHIYGCKALPNGGVIAYGKVNFHSIRDETARGYLLYYHPTKQINTIVETQCIASLPQIFPNPAHSQFTVTNTGNANLYLYNIVGQEVLQTYSTEGNTVVNIGFLPQGVYVLKVVKEGSSSVHKIVVSD